MNRDILSQRLASLGPGLLWAGAAIGVSHLVQSTTAGAHYGVTLVWVVLLANIIKYPFFEFALRYSTVTQENVLQGYARLGRWSLWLFLLLSIGTMFTVQAAVTIVTAGLAPHLFGGDFSITTWVVIILAVCIGILTIGRYRTLDNVIKAIIVLLAICTVAALYLAWFSSHESIISHASPFLFEHSDMVFLIALIGWMPCPIEGSVWHSLWWQEKAKQLGHYPTLSNARFDFNVSYVTTTLLALCFLALGALVLHSQEVILATSSLQFSEQLIAIYTDTLGPWAHWFITLAAFTTMFSTTLTVLDAAPRALHHCVELISKQKHHDYLYWCWLLIIVLGTLLLIFFYTSNMRALVTIATTLSFLTAPVFALLNYHLVTQKSFNKQYQPSLWWRLFSLLGITCLVGIGIWYLIELYI